MQSTVTKPRLSQAAAERGVRVAVIDASLVFRGLTSRWLAELPEIGDVATFSNADSVLRRPDTEAPDIIVLDLGLSETNGHAILRALHARFAECLILIIAPAQRDPSVADNVKKMGAQGILTRPVSLSQTEESRAFKSTFTMSVLTLAQRGTRRRHSSRRRVDHRPLTETCTPGDTNNVAAYNDTVSNNAQLAVSFEQRRDDTQLRITSRQNSAPNNVQTGSTQLRITSRQAALSSE